MQSTDRRENAVHVAAGEGSGAGESATTQADRPGEVLAPGASLPVDEAEESLSGWAAAGILVVLATVIIFTPKLAIDAWFDWHWKERLAEIRAPYEFENRETMFKLCTTFLQWNLEFGRDEALEGMDVVCVPEIPPKMPMRVQNLPQKRQDRLEAGQ